MTISWHFEPGTHDLVFSGRVKAVDLVRLRLDPLDRAVVNSSMTNAADLFQTLEILFRRAAEQGGG